MPLPIAARLPDKLVTKMIYMPCSKTSFSEQFNKSLLNKPRCRVAKPLAWRPTQPRCVCYVRPKADMNNFYILQAFKIITIEVCSIRKISVFSWNLKRLVSSKFYGTHIEDPYGFQNINLTAFLNWKSSII